MIDEFAPAKVNLCLHVTGQNSDGYHLLDSLVLFTAFGDRLSVSPQTDWVLKLSGPYAQDIPQGADNLVLRAGEMTNPGGGAFIHLEKNLPPAAGIGGGSSDAAAAIRALSKLYPKAWAPETDLTGLGADVPVCMCADLTRMSGIGERLTRMGPPPSVPIVLVNPGVSLNTADVFQSLAQKENPPLPADIPSPNDLSNWLIWLTAQRNDLERPALKLQPAIGAVLAALNAFEGTKLARMSGSGATCFAITETAEQCDSLAALLKHRYPNWWVVATQSLTDSGA